MNLRNVLRTYALLRQLSDDESALLATLHGMNDSEREAMVVAMQPEKMNGKKKPSKKAGSGGKSSRASNMAATLNRNLAQQREAATKDIGSDDSQPRCGYRYPDGGINAGQVCDEERADPAHDKSLDYLSYHEFVAPNTGSATGSAMNTEIKQDVVSAAGTIGG